MSALELGTGVTLLVGDARETLLTLAPESVHCAVTSPPFFHLRDYHVAGQIGLEESVEAYVRALVHVFREVARVLRPDGTLWVELGDTYGYGIGRNKVLLGVPWRLSFALEAEGWLRRGEIIWHRPNPMPESPADRPMRAHTTVFLFSRTQRYFYDCDGFREPRSGSPRRTGRGAAAAPGPDARNARTVWTIPTVPYRGAHLAVFPPELPRRCVSLGSSERGCCRACGAPWRRLVRTEGSSRKPRRDERDGPRSDREASVRRFTTGWAAACGCEAGEPVPCVVLDPFAGSGTTLQAARWLGRAAVGCELNPAYVPAMRERLAVNPWPAPRERATEPARQLTLEVG